MKKNLLILFISIVFSVVCAELILYLIYPKSVYENIMQLTDDKKLVYYPRENICVPFEGSKVRLPKKVNFCLNNDGLRDDNHSVNKKPGIFRILIIGDSFTFGEGVEQSDTYPKKLEQYFNKKSKQNEIEVVNMGVPGYNTVQEVEYFKLKGLKYEPDMVILGFLYNDLEPSYEIFERPNFILYYLPDSNIKSFLYRMWINNNNIENDKMKNNKDYMNKRMPIFFNSLNELTELADKHKFSIVFLMLFPSIYQPFNEQLNNYLALKNIHSIDLFKIYNQPGMILNPEDVHPNEKCHDLFAKEIANYLTDNRLMPMEFTQDKNPANLNNLSK